MFALLWCNCSYLWNHFTFPLFFLPYFPLHYHSLLLFHVFCQLWPRLNSEDQMGWDGQITSERQRWSCILENLTLFSFNSSDFSSSAIWGGYCLQLRVMDILLNITILPVPTDHLVLALHLLPEVRSQAYKIGQETLLQHIAAMAFSASSSPACSPCSSVWLLASPSTPQQPPPASLSSWWQWLCPIAEIFKDYPLPLLARPDRRAIAGSSCLLPSWCIVLALSFMCAGMTCNVLLHLQS